MVGTKYTGGGKEQSGNVEAKEFICMTHGHELRWVNDGWKWGNRAEGNKGEKKMGKL